MEISEKLEKLLSHWIEHNTEHAKSYLKWADEVQKAGKSNIAELLKKAHEETLKINQIFEEAKNQLKEVNT